MEQDSVIRLRILTLNISECSSTINRRYRNQLTNSSQNLRQCNTDTLTSRFREPDSIIITLISRNNRNRMRTLIQQNNRISRITNSSRRIRRE